MSVDTPDREFAMIDCYLNAMRRYAVVDGRTSRYDYWMFVLAVLAIAFAALVLEGLFGLGSDEVRPLVGLVSLVHFVPNLAITARRLHDQDRSAWWMLLYLTVVGGIVIIMFMLLPGTPGNNRFGPGEDDYASDLEYSNDQSNYTTHTLTDEIGRLAELRANGSLTDEEFAMMKSRLLARGGN